MRSLMNQHQLDTLFLVQAGTDSLMYHDAWSTNNQE
jgi:hypothetical protein